MDKSTRRRAARRTHTTARAAASRGAASVALLPPAVAPVERQAAAGNAETWADAWRYGADLMQRSVLFLDVLRERADNMLAHERAGQPPLLDFDSDLVLDARTFARPANYALLRITRCGPTHACDFERQDLRPALIIDPRAGHGPGIGGFKHDSEVGIALQLGHPTYFAIFYPEPCPGQTLADVIHALRAFSEEVAKRHGTAPVLYGNCQGGWAVALLAADCQGLDGPAVLNGSPLSYWAGEEDVNPGRLAGGLLGGAWLTHFVADLGGGRFDGAWLVHNFENLKPAHTWWQKNYHLFAHVDTERERFLDFERWWSSYYFLSREEMLAIVENLFVGNRLEQGQVKLDTCEMPECCCVVDLKRIRNPIVVFASSGDNITPPHQALAWLPAIYPDTAALKAAGQRIVYLLNPHVGHLGIFVSASIARHEHRAILENVEAFKDLAPGLYEMKIVSPAVPAGSERAGESQRRDAQPQRLEVRFEERRVEDLKFDYPRQAFEKVAALSEWNEWAYRYWVSPWVRWSANPASAFVQKWGHPMRLRRALFSPQITPAMALVVLAAAWARAMRAPAADDNPWRQREASAGAALARALEAWGTARDAGAERLFAALYGRS